MSTKKNSIKSQRSQFEQQWYQNQLQRSLICVDPESQHVYLLNPETNNYTILKNVSEKYRLKAKQAIQDLKSVINLNNGKWALLNPEVERYRRRRFPSYLLSTNQTDYPVYLCQYPLSKAFQDEEYIRFNVDISNYQDQIKDPIKIELQMIDRQLKYIDQEQKGLSNYDEIQKKRENLHMKKQEIYKLQKSLKLEIKANLNTSANEVLKNTLREIYIKCNLTLQRNDEEKDFILKIAGFREYFLGPHSLNQYERVRINLRGQPRMDIILTEVSLNKKGQEYSFPPYYKASQDGSTDNINWERYETIPILLWYPPEKLKTYKPIEKEIEKMQNLEEEIKNIGEKLKYYNDIIKNGDVDLNDDEIKEYNTLSNKNRDIKKLNKQLAEQQKKVKMFEKQFQPANQRKQKFKDNQYLKNTQYKYYSNSVIKQVSDIFNLKQYVIEDKYKKIESNVRSYGNKPKTNEDSSSSNKDLDWMIDNRLKFKVNIKQGIETLVQDRKKLLDKQIFPVENFTLLSGENIQPFQLKIKGIQNLQIILKQADEKLPDEQRASFTGILPLKYIQKSDEYKKARDKDEKIWREFLKEGKPQVQLKFYKKFDTKNKDKTSLPNEEDIPKLFNPLNISHGKQGQTILQQIAKRYDLDFTPYTISLRIKILTGSILIGEVKETKKIAFSMNPKWEQWLKWDDLVYNQLPAETRIGMDIIIYPSTGNQSQIIGSSTHFLFDQQCEFLQGQHGLNIWPFYMIDERLVCSKEYWGMLTYNKEQEQNQLKQSKIRGEKEMTGQQKKNKFLGENFGRIYIETETFIEKMYWSLKCQKSIENIYKTFPLKKQNDYLQIQPNNQAYAKLEELLTKDPLDRHWTDNQRLILFISREYYKSEPTALEFFLSSLKPTEPQYLREAYSTIQQWGTPTPESCLPFLDAIYGDEIIRLYAVKQLSSMSHDEFQLYMIELIQCLMFENNHYSPLCEMLLERGLRSPYIVGRELFWGLRSQLHLRASYERFSLILEQFIMLCGGYRDNLMQQIKANDQLIIIAREVKKIKPKGSHEQIFEKKVKNVQDNLDKMYKNGFEEKGIVFAIDNRFQCKKFKLDKINVMNSKKLPLWLVMENVEPEYESPMLIFKDGDDIRQDQLTLQLIRIMDKIWLDNGLDFRMNIYKVLPTLDMIGMIEVVTNSKTTAKIHKEQGGQLGAFDKSTFKSFLAENNPDPASMETCLTNFIHSCAGYCVATYILGIGDRHSDNIMISKKGYLFHIDYGHFLGNLKEKFGIKRERTKFVFTKEMCYVMGGKQGDGYKKFEELCCKGYNLIRKRGHFLINMFRLMLSAGMPELKCEDDIKYLVDILSLDLSKEQADVKFQNELKDTLNSTFRTIDNVIHELVKK